ncbi:Phospholipase/carboxylesterase/thioesterase [Absidia repens]|uniref:Acyl-protein thioesterase 1 n=1 Tax=Absidia repens TaxID=90262 RepID=A0A1X2IGG6_9FUNG|nr:Phospholipase/carboxylesterase/thioesterase [Absidia repens]
MTSTAIEPVIIPPTGNHTCTVIFLHGLGDTGLGWLFLAEELGPRLPTVKWILPNSPLRPVSFNGDALIPAWFNVTSFEKSSQTEQVDEEGMLSSVQMVDALIQKELRQGMQNIILGGFSQGCVLSLLTGLTIKTPLAGIIGVSGWLPLGEKFTSMASDANKQTPLLICHGDDDPVVKYRYGRASARYLAKLGYSVDFKTYPGLGHSTSAQEIQDIAAFIQQRTHSPSSAKL